MVLCGRTLVVSCEARGDLFLCLLLLFAVRLLVLFSETPGPGGCQVRVKKIFLFSFVWQVIGDKINYVLSERGAASALGGQGGVFKVGCLSGVLLVAIFLFSLCFWLCLSLGHLRQNLIIPPK